MIAIPQYSVKNIQFKEGNEGALTEAIITLQRDEASFKCSCGYQATGYYDSSRHLIRDLPYGKWSKIS